MGFSLTEQESYVTTFCNFLILVAGLAASDLMQRDLMATYGASYGQALFKLRLPAAMPFYFQRVEDCHDVRADRGRVFGSPIRGMGFRISTEVGWLGLDMVWAKITVAALAGSAFMGRSR